MRLDSTHVLNSTITSTRKEIWQLPPHPRLLTRFLVQSDLTSNDTCGKRVKYAALARKSPEGHVCKFAGSVSKQVQRIGIVH